MSKRRGCIIERNHWFIAACLLVTIGIMVMVAGSAAAADWQFKVVPSVLNHDPQQERDFLIYLADQADLSGAARLPDKTARTTFVYEALRVAADRSQPIILDELRTLGLEGRPFWIVNAILVTADEDVLEYMASRSDVTMVYGNPLGSIPDPPEAAVFGPALSPLPMVSENLVLMGVPEVWAAGTTGEGAVVAVIDTGALWTHEALINSYRGWDGVTADHNHNWYDVTDTSPQEPADPHGHGTKVLGVIVGDDGGAHRVGVAPGARWIACRLTGSGLTLDRCLAALQWVAAPTDVYGFDPDPALAPDVVQNSWICGQYDGCADPLILEPAFENLRAAGIFAVAAAGNDGPNCGTIYNPPMIYDGVFTVGSSTMIDEVSDISSRGPVTVDGSGRLKPDATAPGPQLTTSNDGGYVAPGAFTSYTSPHASGLAALLISAVPSLRSDMNLLEEILHLSAVPLTTTQECGGVPGTAVPNNTFGWGRLDALSAYSVATSSLFVAVDGPQQVPADGGQVTFGNVELRYFGSDTDVVDVSLDTSDLPDGWAAHLLYDGSEYQSFSVPLATDETAVFQVVMDTGTLGSGRVLADIASQGSGEVVRTLEFAGFAGGTDLLIVSDDTGAGHAYDVYGPAIDPTGKTYAVWNRDLAGITADDVLPYEAIVWQTGNTPGVVNAEDRATVDAYLAAGGNLFLAGDDILESLYSQGGQARLWYHLKMRIGYGSGNSGDHDVIGMPGTVGDGLAFTLTGGDPDQLVLLSGQPVEEAFRFGNGEPAGTQTTYADYQIMYLPFGLEKVPDQGDQVTIIDGVLRWFNILTPAADDVPLGRIQLSQNAPNPFNPRTIIQYFVPATSFVELAVFDVRGRQVARLVQEEKPAGRYEIVWGGADDLGRQVPTGTYFCRLTAAGESRTTKMVLVR